MSRTDLYELMYIVPVKYAGDSLDPIIEEVEKKITELNGKILRNENLGIIRFSYRIKEHTQGFYVNVEFEMDKENLSTLHNWFLLKQEVLRYLIIKINPSQQGGNVVFGERKADEKDEKKRKNSDHGQSKKGNVDTSKEEKVVKKDDEAEVKEDKKDTSKEEKGEDKTKLNDLGEKLDEILESEPPTI